MTLRRALLPLLLALAAIVAVAPLAGCGKKAPPLPPLVGSKPRVKDLALRQVGTTVRARFSMPVRAGQQTVDYRTKAIELWRRPVEKPTEGEAEKPKPRPPAPAPGGSPEDESPGLPVKEFTSSATLAQVIEGDALFDLLSSAEPEMVDQLASDLYGTELEYGLVLKSDLKSSGTVSDLATITPAEPPATPTGVAVEAVQAGLRLTWTPAEDDAGKPIPVMVYRTDADRPFGSAPYRNAPVDRSPFEDTDIVPETTYRYLLRSVVPGAKPALESDATAEAVSSWRDLFPPAVPSGLRVFVDSAKATLLWTPNDEPDLVGYHAWRRIPGGEWQRVTTAPLTSATFTDAALLPGRKLEYAVTSIDRSAPPNESVRSASVTAGLDTE